MDEAGAGAEASVNGDGSVAVDATGDSSATDSTVADGAAGDGTTAETSSPDGARADASTGDGATDASSAADAQDASSTTDASADGPVADGGADTGAVADGGTDTGAQDAASDAGADGGAFSANYTFDTTTEGWSVIDTSDHTALSAAAVSWNGALGDPTAGSLRVTVPFSQPSQSVMVGFAPASPIDLTGRTITVHVYLEAGLSSDPANPGAIQVFAQDAPNWHWVSAGWTTLSSTNAGQWFTATLDLTATGNPQFDAAHVQHWGVQILTGGSPATPNYLPAVVDFDNVTVQ